eukprot:NODE_1011_length_1940_cov_132.615300_g960_i0.p1 GENE.NODE_1011_length_1940_cov_132.615300_g960_i0~~NODE_1011_length_1940_cov_132.615300_g960_i0.p1  ORF type:complete len:563 (+),score=105.46 NODE_1011_length_1940_cov_132.615300_g960_i0:58-1689(+)
MTSKPQLEFSDKKLPKLVTDALQTALDKLDRTNLKLEADWERTRLVEHSIFKQANPRAQEAKGDPAVSNLSLVQQVTSLDPEVDRAVGCIIGNALGDCVGHPLEFLDVDPELPAPPEGRSGFQPGAMFASGRSHLSGTHLHADGRPVYYNELNQFRLKPGQWTDDFSMALCLADTMLVHGGFQGWDARLRWFNWWCNGYNNAFRFDQQRRGRSSVGLRLGCFHQLEEYQKKPVEKIPGIFDGEGEDAGNGSIMRLSPVPIAYHSDVATARQVAQLQSRGTHPGNDAASACDFLTYFCIRAIKLGLPEAGGDGKRKDTPTMRFVDECVASYIKDSDMDANSGMQRLHKLLLADEPEDSTEVCWNWRATQLPINQVICNRRKNGTYNGYPILPGYFGSYCMDGLSMSLWALYRSDNFESAIVRIVNLLGDADSTGAVAGQMAGALYGYTAIKDGPEVAYLPGKGKRTENRLDSQLTDSQGTEVDDSQATQPLPAQSTSSSTTTDAPFKTMGEAWLSHLRNWDPFSEIPLRAILLYYMKTPTNVAP